MADLRENLNLESENNRLMTENKRLSDKNLSLKKEAIALEELITEDKEKLKSIQKDQAVISNKISQEKLDWMNEKDSKEKELTRRESIILENQKKARELQAEKSKLEEMATDLRGREKHIFDETSRLNFLSTTLEKEKNNMEVAKVDLQKVKDRVKRDLDEVKKSLIKKVEELTIGE